MKVLVTGVSGRFGPYAVRELEKAGHEIVLFSRKKPQDEFAHLTWIQGDVNDYEDCMRAMKGGFDAIQHLAAKPSPTDHPKEEAKVSGAGRDPGFDMTMRTNIMGLYYLLQAALQNDIGTFVMTGSNCALGHGYRISDRPFPIMYLPIDEEHPSDVEDSYSYSKLAGEMLLASYAKAYGMRTYALRSAGIRNEEQRVQMARNVRPAASWDEWLWPWIASEDLASAHRLLMEQAHRIEPHGVYFCNNDDTSALEPTKELIEKFRPDLLPLAASLQGYESLMSNRKLKESVGWTPVCSWREYL
jgi:UDP-glucose 4-epimerase